MRCFKIIAFTFLLILFAQIPLLFSEATAAEYGEISIQHVPLCSPKTGTEPTTHGSIEYRFRIQNRSQSRARTVMIELKSNRSDESGLKSLIGAVEVPAGQTVQLSLVQPPIQMDEVKAIVRIDGRAERTPLPVSAYTHCSSSFVPGRHYGMGGSSSNPSHIMVSRKCSTAFRDLFTNGTPSALGTTTVPGGMPGAGGMMGTGAYMPSSTHREITIWGAESDADQWSDLWLAYTRFEAVVLEASEMEAIYDSSPVAKALIRYVESGGTLCVIGSSWEAPKEWKAAHSSGDFSQWDVNMGTVYFLNRPADSSGDAVELIRKRLFSRADAWANAMQTNPYGSSSGYYHYGSSITPGTFGDSRPLANTLPVSYSVGVPIRVISVLIVIFAIIIGPVNVYFLSLKNRRIWLLWTVPAISLLTSGIVLGTNILREGFVSNTSISSVTVLDQRRGEAVSIGVLGFYSTFTPRRGLEFENATEVIPMTERSTVRGNIITYPGGEQNFVSGWVQARVPTYFAFRKAGTDIRRLEFQWESESGNPTVANHLGVNLTNLLVCSPDGEFYTVSTLIAGEKVELKKTDSPTLQTGSTTFASAAQRFENWATIEKTVLNNVAPSPGSYRAKIEGTDNPFVEPGISGMHSFQNNSAIIGYF